MIRVTLKSGHVVLIDSEDGDLREIFPGWSLLGNNHVQLTRSIPTDFGSVIQKIYLARVIVIRQMGLTSIQHYMVDHADRDPLNNRRSNLRLASHQQNLWNRGGNTETGFKGVCRKKRKIPKPFVAYIGGNGEFKKCSIGYFATAEEAARAYDAEAKRRFGEFAYLNFPEETE